QRGNQRGIEGRGKNRREQTPSHHRVPSGRPEYVDSCAHIVVHHRIDLRYGYWKMGGVEKALAQPKKRKKQRNLQGIDEVVHNLYGRKIQTQNERGKRTKRGGRSQDREDPESQAQGDAQGQLLWCDALAKQVEYRAYQTAMEQTFFHFPGTPAMNHLQGL